VVQERDGGVFDAFDADGVHLGSFAKLRDSVRAIPVEGGAS